MAFNNNRNTSLLYPTITATSSRTTTTQSPASSSSGSAGPAAIAAAAVAQRTSTKSTVSPIRTVSNASIRDLLAEIEDVSKEDFEQTIKPAIYEQLDKNQTYENSNLSYLVQHYLDTYSKRTFKILIGLESPLDEYLFNALLIKLNIGENVENLQPVLVLLSNIVQTSPSWLPKFINSKSLKQFFAILKNEQDVVILGYAVLILVELVASLPSVISECLLEIFECFSRLTAFLYKSKPKHDNRENVLFLQMNSIVYRLFLRLYGLYPCNFVEYLKNNYGVCGTNTNSKIFSTIIEPMMGKIRFHPSLIATSKADECKNTRWFYKETHDILAECAHYAIDPLEFNFDSHYSNGDGDLEDFDGHHRGGHDDEDNDVDDEEDTSSSSNSFVSHHETFPLVHKVDRPDVIFNQLNQSVINSKFGDLSPLSAKNLIPETELLRTLESGQDALNLGPDSMVKQQQTKPTIVIEPTCLKTKVSRNIAISPFKPIESAKCDFDFKDLQKTDDEQKKATILKKISAKQEPHEHEHEDDDDLEVSRTMQTNLSQSSKNNLLHLNVDHSELVGNIKKSFKKASSRIRYQSHCLPDPISTNDPFCLDKQTELASLRALSQSCPSFCFEFLPFSSVNESPDPKDGRRSQSETRRLSSTAVKECDDSNDEQTKESKRINRKKACKSVDFTKEGQLKYRQRQKQLKQQQSIDLNRLIKTKDSVTNVKQPQEHFTPHELLDRVMLFTSEILHNKFLNSTAQTNAPATAAPATTPTSVGTSGPSGGLVPEVSNIDFLLRRNSNLSGMSSNENINNSVYEDDMKKQQALLYAQLLFERHQRRQHAIRIRRVYRQNKEIVEVQERLQESKAINQNLKDLIIVLNKKLEESSKEFEADKKEYQERIDSLESELSSLKDEFARTQTEKNINEKRFKEEIQDLNDNFRTTKIELDDYVTNHWNKNVDTAKLQSENLELKNQLILFGEFYNQMRDNYNKSKTFSDINDKFMIESLQNDNKDLKHQLQDCKLQIDSLSAKCQKLQLELDDGDSIQRTKTDNQEIAVLTDELKMKDQQMEALNTIIIHYDKYIHNLKGQQAILERDKAILSANRPGSNSDHNVLSQDQFTSQPLSQASSSHAV